MQIDLNTEFGARAQRRLKDEAVIWLTTVRPDGTPEPSPVWFFWDGTSFLIYSQANRPKVRNIARDPRVALNFDSDGRGGDIVIFTGDARVAPDELPVNQHAAYLAKYRDHITRIGMNPDSFAREYSVPIRVTPGKLRGF